MMIENRLEKFNDRRQGIWQGQTENSTSWVGSEDRLL